MRINIFRQVPASSCVALCTSTIKQSRANHRLCKEESTIRPQRWTLCRNETMALMQQFDFTFNQFGWNNLLIDCIDAPSFREINSWEAKERMCPYAIELNCNFDGNQKVKKLNCQHEIMNWNEIFKRLLTILINFNHQMRMRHRTETLSTLIHPIQNGQSFSTCWSLIDRAGSSYGHDYRYTENTSKTFANDEISSKTICGHWWYHANTCMDTYNSMKLELPNAKTSDKIKVSDGS